MTTRLGDLLLFSLLPQLRAAEEEIRYARVKDDRDHALRGILKWRGVMADVSGFLAARGLASRSDDAVIANCGFLTNTSEDRSRRVCRRSTRRSSNSSERWDTCPCVWVRYRPG